MDDSDKNFIRCVAGLLGIVSTEKFYIKATHIDGLIESLIIWSYANPLVSGKHSDQHYTDKPTTKWTRQFTY